MKTEEILNHFEHQAKVGKWDSLYDPKNPESFSFIVRLRKTLNLLKDVNNKKICDLGCGTGILIPYILEKKCKYTGIDFSKEMLEKIKSKYPQEILNGQVNLLLSDFRNINETNEFDVFIGLGFIEYFDNPKEIISKLYNMMPKDGTLILSFPNINSFDFMMIRFLTILRIIVKKIFKIGKPNAPRKMWSKKEACKILKETGFKDFQIKNYEINIFVYPFTVFFPRIATFITKKLEYTWLEKINFFARGFLISTKK